MVVGWLFSFVAVVCPYICNAETSQNQVSAHSCCPDKETKETNKKDSTDPCCDQHDQILSTKQSTDSNLDSIQYQLIAFVIKLTGNSTIQNTANFVVKESPPGVSYSEPLYIIKDSFLI